MHENECFTTTCRCMAIHLQVARAREEAHPTGPSWLPSAEPQVSREDAMRTLRALAEGTRYEGPERRQHLVGLTDIDSALALTLEPGFSRTRGDACLYGLDQGGHGFVAMPSDHDMTGMSLVAPDHECDVCLEAFGEDAGLYGPEQGGHGFAAMPSDHDMTSMRSVVSDDEWDACLEASGEGRGTLPEVPPSVLLATDTDALPSALPGADSAESLAPSSTALDQYGAESPALPAVPGCLETMNLQALLNPPP